MKKMPRAEIPGLQNTRHERNYGVITSPSVVKKSELGEAQGDPDKFVTAPVVRFTDIPQIPGVNPVPEHPALAVSPITYRNLPDGSARVSNPHPLSPVETYVGTPVVELNFQVSVAVLQPLWQYSFEIQRNCPSGSIATD